MKEENQNNRIKCHRLRSLRLYQRKSQKNEYKNIEQTNKTDNNEHKTNYNKNMLLYKNNSSEYIFNNINQAISRRIIFSPITKEQNKNHFEYEIEKGIPKNSLCKFSKNKYHFGTSRIIFPKNFKNESSQNITPKISEQNHLISNLNFRKIFKLNNKSASREKIPIIKLNKESNNNRIAIYKRYNNDQGLDRHIIFNKSCPYTKSEIEYTFFDNNSTKEDISRLIPSKNNLNQILYKNNSNNKTKKDDAFLSTIEYSNMKKGKNINKLFNSSTYKRQYNIRNLSYNIKKSKRDKSKKKNFTNIMSKYHFVMNNYLLKINNNKDIPSEIKEINKNNFNSLKRENQKLFPFFKSIIPINKFSEKYRDPLNNSLDKEIEEERKVKEKTYIKQDILPGVKLLKEMEIEIKKRTVEKKVLKGKSLMNKLKKIIIRNAQYIKRLNVTYEEMIYKYKISPIAFHHFKTEELILAIRNKNYELSCDILDNYKYIVLDYDYFHLTPLHWAVKNNFYQIIPKLIAYGSYINEKNSIGETPLHITARKKYYESTILLLIYLASPFIKNSNNKKPSECTKDLQLSFIFKTIIEIHLKYLILKQKHFYDNVQKDFIDFVIVEFSTQLNPEFLDLIKNIQ